MLAYLQTEKLVCHIFIDAARDHKTLGSELTASEHSWQQELCLYTGSLYPPWPKEVLKEDAVHSMGLHHSW